MSRLSLEELKIKAIEEGAAEEIAREQENMIRSREKIANLRIKSKQEKEREKENNEESVEFDEGYPAAYMGGYLGAEARQRILGALRRKFSRKRESVEVDEFHTQAFHGVKMTAKGAVKVVKGFKKFARESVELGEATKWKMGDGRPRGGARIENIRFWDMTKDKLQYIIKDAGEAMKANPKARKATTGPGNWADQVNDAHTVLGWRKKNGIKESVELDESWTADSVMKNATIGSKKGYGITIKKTGAITKTPYKHMLMTNRPHGNVRVTFDHGKDEFEGTPQSVALYINKKLGIKESVELDESKMSELHMHIKDGKTAEQIAKIMKIDLKTVKALMKDMKESYLYEATTEFAVVATASKMLIKAFPTEKQARQYIKNQYTRKSLIAVSYTHLTLPTIYSV
mgnify:CR=1 FL=1